MKIADKIIFHAVAIGVSSILMAHAGNTVVLEGFENGLTTNSQGKTNISSFTTYGTPRGVPVSVSIYTATNASDPRVTQGTHSAKIVFPADGFGNDFLLALSDAACALIEMDAFSNQPARYILRYDVILEKVDSVLYFNEHFFVANNWDYVRSGGGYRTNYNGELFEVDSMSVPLELPENDFPTNKPSGTNSGDFASAAITGLTGFFSDQFGAVTEPLTNFTIYIDNVRIVDTYETPTTVPVVYPLQSFENPANLLGGVSNLFPSQETLSIYTTNGQYNASTDGGIPDSYASALNDYETYVTPQGVASESDFAVTDGTGCLMVSNNASGYNADFSLPLAAPYAANRLVQILNLNLSPAQLAHYTIRWDVTTPYVPVFNYGSDGDYFQLDYAATTGSILPMSTGRRQSDTEYGFQRQTYSETLDQIAYWGATPALTVLSSISGTWTGDPYYFDNFRLIDTAPRYTVITSQSYNSSTGQFTLTWLSEPGQKYSVQYSTDLTKGFITNLATNIPSGGDFTTTTVAAPNGAAGYIRISAQ
jgi:hypothetical protein